jgi:hypothetical protein
LIGGTLFAINISVKMTSITGKEMNHMKKEIIKHFGNISDDSVKRASGKSTTQTRNSGDMMENIADSIIDTICLQQQRGRFKN